MLWSQLSKSLWNHGEETAGRWLRRKGRRQIETREKFGIEKPCRVINSAIFEGIFKLWEFRPKDHEMRLEAHTVQSVVQNLLKEPRQEWDDDEFMTNFQVRHLDARSMVSTGSLVAWDSNQKKSQASSGQPAMKNWSLTSIWRRKKNAIFFFATSISFRKRVSELWRAILNRLPVDEMEGIDKHSLIWRMFMSSSTHAAIFLGKGYSENLHSVRNTDWKPTVQKLFDVTQQLICWQKLEILGVSEWSWGNSTWEKLSLAEDEEVIKLMKAKVYVRLCIVRWKDARTHQNPMQNGNVEFLGSRTQMSAENWMESMENQRSSSGWHSQDTLRCRSSTRSKTYANLGMQRKRIPRTNYLHVDVLTTWNGEMRTTKKVFTNCENVHQQIRHRSLVILRAWFRNEVVQYTQGETWRTKGPGE